LPFSHGHQPFTDYTVEDFKSLVSTNLEGFLYVTELFHRVGKVFRGIEPIVEKSVVASDLMEFTRFGFDETLEVIKGIILA